VLPDGLLQVVQDLPEVWFPVGRLQAIEVEAAGLHPMPILTHQEVHHITVRQEAVDLQLADRIMEDPKACQDPVIPVQLQQAQDLALLDLQDLIPDQLDQLIQDRVKVIHALPQGHPILRLRVVRPEDLAAVVA
jgi:hypothetical protein